MLSLAAWGNKLNSGEVRYDITGRRRVWLSVALAFVVISLSIVGIKGLNPGIEFRGGSEFRVDGVSSTDSGPATEVLRDAGVTEVPRISTVGSDSLRIQTTELEASQIEVIRSGLAEAYGTTQITSSFIGPQWGADVTSKALWGGGIFLLIVSLVMALYFRTWTMSVAAITALLHDLIVTVGVYALVGFEVSPASVIGFLTILGYSLYDTVVVFDKVRENTAKLGEQDRVTYSEAANLAVNQTIVRSINTSVTGVLPVAAILFVGSWFLGAGTLRDIALALFVGLIISTVSSVLVATPVDVALRERSSKVREHTARVLELRTAREDLVASDAASAAALGTAVVQGSHRGQAAQPRRKKRKK